MFERFLVKVGLAPMEGVTDYPVRTWFGLFAQMDFQWTPFMRVTPSFPHTALPKGFAPELFTPHHGKPLIFQLMAANPDHFCHAAAMVLEKTPFVDLNLGCPAPKVVGHGAGSQLLSDVNKLALFLDQIFCKVPAEKISLKIRTGFNDTNSFDDLISLLANYPIRGLTLHGRTRAQRYTGKADWNFIQAAQKKVDCTVTGSGDIFSFQAYDARSKKYPEIKRAIIGRGALRNPLIFEEILHNKSSEFFLEDLVAALKVYFHLHLQFYHDLHQSIEVSTELLKNDNDQNSFKAAKTLERRLAACTIDNPKAERRALCRLKLFWNYLRGSLDQPFQTPTILRAKSVENFFEQLELVASTRNTRAHFSHFPERDWIYAGEKNPAKDAQRA